MIKVTGVRWQETIEIFPTKSGVTLQVMTTAGRLFRSTSFHLTKKEALRLADELRKNAN
jgi:hypothetical protein